MYNSKETTRQSIQKNYDDISCTYNVLELDAKGGHDILDLAQKLSERAGLNFYDAYWNLDSPDDLVFECLDLYRACRRLIPETYGSNRNFSKRPGAAEAHLTTQEGMMTA
jgi:hypothetical protein